MPLNVSWTAYPNPENITGFYKMFQYANTVTYDYFGLGLILGLWTVLFLIFRRSGDIEGFAASSLITMVLGGFLRSGGLIGDPIFLLLTALAGVSLLLLWKGRG